MFGSDHYCEEILSEILRVYPVCPNRRLVVHADNTRPHTSKQTREFMDGNSLRGALHPPLSPDLAPSAFFSLGYIKGKV
jgi:transposase